MKFLVVFDGYVPDHSRIKFLITKFSFRSFFGNMNLIKVFEIIFLERVLKKLYIMLIHLVLFPNCSGVMILSHSGMAKHKLCVLSFSQEGQEY